MTSANEILQKLGLISGQYAPLIPLFLLSFVIALILAPILGRLAVKVGAVDLPGFLRGRGDPTAGRRIHESVTPYFGGLAMFIAFVTTLLVFNLADPRIQDNPFTWGVVAGLIVVFAYSLLDDVFGLSLKWQFAAQFVAALAVVMSNVRIPLIDIAGFSQNFQLNVVPILGHNFIFPADLITILWIMAIINFVNWVGGVDGLNGMVSAIAASAILFIAIRTGTPTDLFLSLIIGNYLGANLGVLPYNYPPAHIYFGSIGDHINGFLLAVFPLLGSSSSKLPIAIILLGLPIIDALWVMFVRIRQNGFNTKNPFKILLAATISDRNHLHHRLLDMGYSRKVVLYIEVTIALVLSTIAYSVEAFRFEFVGMIGAVAAVLGLFVIVSISRKRAQTRQEKQRLIEAASPKPQVKIVDRKAESETEKFVY